MERSEILATMGELKLYGMKAAYDEIIASAVKRQHEPQRVVGDLLAAEIAEKQARSIKYQITIARAAFGDEVVDHYLNQARVEVEAFDAAVTDWERVRGFERL